MKLIKRKTLHYQEATSDKIYEVDLCEVSEGKYLVNFRNGRRGASLKSGTKTTQAVNLTEAERVFDKLVAEKTRKGYQEVTAQPISQQATIVTVDDPRKQAILKRLENNQPSTWKLERAIWRAGELKIKETTPLLINLLGTGEPLRDYCIAWSLGWCAGDEAIPVLTQLHQDSTTPEFVQRIAFEALLKLSDSKTKANLQRQKIENLPKELKNLALNGSAREFATVLKSYLERAKYQRFGVLDTIYQIDSDIVRPGLLDILCDVPLKPNYFQRIRHIFKMAEYRRDAEVFGILAYCFETEAERFNNYYRVRHWDSIQKKYVQSNERAFTHELKKPDSDKAYSKQTREYLLRRVWRTLRKLGQEGDADYVNMAVGVLLQYSDSDAEAVQEKSYYRYSQTNGRWNYTQEFKRWDAFAGHLTFNHILYENSPRYELKANNRAWRCRSGYKPGDPEPKVREEAFPELWERNPQSLLDLLQESDCVPVHQFAVKALRVCSSFCAGITISTIIKLLNQPYEVTAQFAFDLARLSFNSSEPNTELVIALANCLLKNARKQAFKWVEEQPQFFLEDTNFIASLVISKQADTRAFVSKFLRAANFSETKAKVLIARIITNLLNLTETESQLGKDVSEFLLSNFSFQLHTLSLSVIQDLLAHPLVDVQEFAVNILLNHEIKTEDLPSEIIESLIASPYELLQVLGIRLFGQLPDAKLIGEDSNLIVAMAVSANRGIRDAIQPIIRRLGSAYPDFAIQLAADFIDIILIPEKHEGVHSFLLGLLKDDLQNWISSVSKESTLQLLKAKSPVAQDLGGFILGQNYLDWVEEFETSEVVKLANHEIVTVREAAQRIFLQILDRLRASSQEMISAVRMLESKWDDSRDFAFELFTSEFGAEEFTPEVLVGICDSVREETRRLGRDLLTRNFQAADGERYLLKFSEHPTADMQLFASNYLEAYAADNPGRLRDLIPFFVSVLCRVNKGSVAKKRIFAFLEKEGLHSEDAARIVGEIMARQSVTMAIGDKAMAIQIMLKISKSFPHINLPIGIKEVVEVRK